jgi:small subunit ribosomal protein S17
MMAENNQNTRGRRNEVTGEVISDKMDKTITVQTYRLVKHPKYKKYMRRTTVFKAHDENNSAKTGDKVRIFETRALSKTKRWKLAEIVESAKVGVAQ